MKTKKIKRLQKFLLAFLAKYSTYILISLTLFFFNCSSNRDKAEELTNIGIELLRAEKDSCYIYFCEAIESDTNYGRAYYYKAIAATEIRSDVYDGIELFSKAISKGFNIPESYLKRGKLKAETKDLTGALKDFNIAKNLDPEITSIAQYKGDAYYANNNFQRALEFYKISSPNYDDKDFYHNRAHCNYLLGHHFDALQDLNEVIEIIENKHYRKYNSEELSMQYYRRGFIKYELGDRLGSLLDLNKSIDINFGNTDAICQRGIQKYDDHDYEGALYDFETVIRINPEIGLAYYYRAKIKIEKKELNNVCIDLSKAGELGVEKTYELIKKFCN